jgi:hypothetical protein
MSASRSAVFKVASPSRLASWPGVRPSCAHRLRRACPDRPRCGGRPVTPVRLVFEDQGWEDYTSWPKTDRKMLARINKLVEDVRRDPFTGIGKPEPLK